MNLARPAAVVFDLDGTLLDTEPLYSIAVQKVLDPFGATYSKELKKRCMGGDSYRTARLTIDEYNLPMDEQQFLDERKVFLSQLFPDSPEIAGAGEFVQLLTQRAVPFGLATSSHKSLCDMKLSRKTWRDLFTEVVCGDDERVVNSKPAPDIFLACADAIGATPADCIAFEDSPPGIEAARSAGMTVIAMSSEWMDPEDLSDAHHIIDSYHDLMELAGSW